MSNSSNNNKVVVTKKYPYLYTATELMTTNYNKIPHLWEPFLITQGLTALVGSSDVGKSSFLRQLAINIVLKKPDFLGHKLNVRFGRVIYFSTEDSQVSVNVLLKKQIDKAVNLTDLEGLCYIFNADDPLKVIEEQLAAEKTDLVIIDSYADVFMGSSNDLGQVRRFLNNYEKLVQKYDCSIIFLHHTGKRTELGSPSKNNILGSQGFEAKMRAVWDLRKQDDSPNRYLQITKGNYLPDTLKSKSMQLLFNDKQEFEFKGHVAKGNPLRSRYSEEEKAAIIKEAKRLIALGFTYDKVLEELPKLGFDEPPAKGSLSKWLKEEQGKETVHSDETV